MVLPKRARRVIRDLRQGFPTRTLAGRLSPGVGPAEFIDLDEVFSAQLDEFFPSAAQGSILYRNATVWTTLAPGTSGHFLKTNGVAANPEWAAASGGSGGSFTATSRTSSINRAANWSTETTVTSFFDTEDFTAGTTFWNGTDNVYEIPADVNYVRVGVVISGEDLQRVNVNHFDSSDVLIDIYTIGRDVTLTGGDQSGYSGSALVDVSEGDYFTVSVISDASGQIFNNSWFQIEAKG